MQPKSCRILWPVVAIAFASQAQPILTHAPEPPETTITQVRTFLGPSVPRVTPVTPAPEVVFAIATDYLNNEQLQQVKKLILDFYTASRGKVPTRLALLNPGLAGKTEPMKTRAQLAAALREVTVNESEAPADPVSAQRFFSTLGETLEPVGGEWAVVVLTGDFPALPPELSPYASALLAAHASANRQRLSVWNLGASVPAFLDKAVGQSAGLTIQRSEEH